MLSKITVLKLLTAILAVQLVMALAILRIARDVHQLFAECVNPGAALFGGPARVRPDTVAPQPGPAPQLKPMTSQRWAEYEGLLGGSGFANGSSEGKTH